MALVYIEDSDPWLTEYDACEKLFREIMEQLTLRDQQPRNSQAYATLSANVRLRMKQYTSEVRQLRIKLDEASRTRSITADEAERRMRQVELLQSKDVQLQRIHDPRTYDSSNSRARLLNANSSVFVDAGTTGWGVDDDNNDDNDVQPIDVHVSISKLKDEQQQMLQDQEQGLEELHKVILRQKELGQSISNEVDHQNEIIDDLADHLDRTSENIINKTQQVKTIQFKDKTCWYWVIIFILFITIIIIALAF